MSAAAPPKSGRRAARLAAVQALYQMETAGASAADVEQDIRAGRLPRAEEALEAEPDLALFSTLIDTVVENQEAIDVAIAHRLVGWKLERIDSVARAILRAGVAELWARKETPSAVVIDEYVEIAKAFFDGPEPGFVNAALDACAGDLRGVATNA
jgi:N utilization substance protein B